jgi:hypothetical protein
MPLFSWLRTRMTGRSGRTPARKPTPRFRPRLEILEAREVPSTLKVTNLSDDASLKGSLRYEIAQAQSNDTIVFMGKFGGATIALNSGNELQINKNLTIQGPNGGLTITSGGIYGPRVFEVDFAAVTLSGLTISKGGGKASANFSSIGDGFGGGILNHSGTLKISNCVLSGNSAYNGWGGGIYNDYGTLTVSNCTLSSNWCSYNGGAIYNGASASVSNSTLSGNSAAQGGGIYNYGTLTVSGSTLSGDSASYLGAFASRGGGIYNAGTLTVSNSVFSNNSPDNIFGSYTDGGGNSFR